MSLTFQRILLKISGESFGQNSPFDSEEINRLVDEITQVHRLGAKIGIVMGAGNILRGASISEKIPRASADYMGMLATSINALFLEELLLAKGCSVQLMTSHEIQGIGEPYHRRRCLKYLDEGKIVLFSGGTSHPFFTTDTSAALRAVEMEAECVLKATKVDGVFDNYENTDDKSTLVPRKHITFEEAISKQYKVMDLTAITFCMENKIPIFVFNAFQEGNLLRVLQSGDVGTKISD